MGGGNSKEKQRKKVAQEHQQKKAKQAENKKEKEEKREQAQRTEDTPGGGKTTGRFIDPGEGERFYVVHTPPGDDTNLPALFFLHDSERYKPVITHPSWVPSSHFFLFFTSKRRMESSNHRNPLVRSCR